ncbi:MAG TPA: serine/threonine-protein kinase [Trichormus sp.]|jgi:serine/threonine protein kinase
MQGKESFAEPKFAEIRCPKCGLELDPGMTICPNDGSEVASLPGLGSIFQHKYQFVSRLGAGGMGVIFKAKQQGLDRFVAVKMLQTARATDVSVLRFQQEAQALARLDHANLVKVHELGATEQGVPFMVMEYIEGKGLDAILSERSQLTLQQFFDIFLQVCDGLQYVHDAGILHRDLKPSNIMICNYPESNPRVKLVDFGIAKFVDNNDAKQLTQTGEVVGSPLYMCPEQAKGTGSDERSDIYSLGCVMYEALSGIVPFSGGSVVEVIMKQFSEKQRPLNSVVRGSKYPNAVEALIDKMLEKDPRDRFQSVSELRDALQKLSAEHRPWYHINVPRIGNEKKKPWFFAALALIVLLSAGVFSYVVWQKREAPISIPDAAVDSAFDALHQRSIQEANPQASSIDDEYKPFLDLIELSHNERITLQAGIIDKFNFPKFLESLKRRKDRYVTELDVHGDRNYIDDRLMPCIQDFPLRYLKLNDTHMTIASIEPISKIRTLESLEIDRMPLTAEACRALIALPNLHELSLRSIPVDDQMFEILCSDSKLTHLTITYAHVTEAGFKAALQKPSPITDLLINSDKFNDKCVELMATGGMPNLVALNIGGNYMRITDKSLPFLAKMHSLRSLAMINSWFDDAGIMRFHAPFLQRIHLSKSDWLTRSGLKHFEQNNPHCSVSWQDGDNVDRCWEDDQAADSVPQAETTSQRRRGGEVFHH